MVIDWVKGTPGKGFITPKGEIWVWTTDEEGSPHHWDAAHEYGFEKPPPRGTGYVAIYEDGKVLSAGASEDQKKQIANAIGGYTGNPSIEDFKISAEEYVPWYNGVYGKAIWDGQKIYTVATPDLTSPDQPTHFGLAMANKLPITSIRGAYILLPDGRAEMVNGGKDTNAAIDAIQDAGYTLEGYENDRWTLSKQAEFQDFFDQAAQGQFAPSQALHNQYLPNDPQQRQYLQTYQQYAGPFDEHIETSIPSYRANFANKVGGIKSVLPEGGSVLDIAASTGSFGKTLSSLSQGKIQTVSLDPNTEMQKTFDRTPVEGAQWASQYFGGDYQAQGAFDVVHESMGFQFIGNNRAEQVAEAKAHLKPGGLFLTEAKVRTPNEAEYEQAKDQWKQQYYTPEALQQKNEQVGFQQQGSMMDNLSQQDEYEQLLQSQFAFVSQYWSSGNFKGYAASDSQDTINRFFAGLSYEPVHNEFAAEEVPRHLGRVKTAVLDLPLTFVSEWQLKSKTKLSHDIRDYEQGSEGKAVILPNGEVYAWTTVDDRPTHLEAMTEYGLVEYRSDEYIDGAGYFVLDPKDGVIETGATEEQAQAVGNLLGLPVWEHDDSNTLDDLIKFTRTDFAHFWKLEQNSSVGKLVDYAMLDKDMDADKLERFLEEHNAKNKKEILKKYKLRKSCYHLAKSMQKNEWKYV